MRSPVRYLVSAACFLFSVCTILTSGGSASTITTLIQPTANERFDELGISVASAGDVNGDGYKDVIVGAWGYSGGTNGTGRAYVYFGGSGADDIADLVLTGPYATGSFGYSVASAGDVNGDGYDDVIVGSFGAAGDFIGHAYIYYGGPSPDNIPDLILTAETPSEEFGISVASAGDLNEDGYGDVIVGADGYKGYAGRAYVFYGGVNTDAVPDMVFTGQAAMAELGYSVASAGDVNGDGHGDLIVGAIGNDAGGVSRAYVYYGGPSADDVADLVLTNIPGFTGYPVSSAGDVNGDGYGDLILGAWPHDSRSGRAYVYCGGANPDNVVDLTLDAEGADNSFGYSVASAGDLNGDGYADIIVGAPGYGAERGRSYVYYGGPSPDALADVILTGEALGDRFGSSVSAAGDVNGDGLADVIVGAPYNDTGGDRAGRAYVFALQAGALHATVDIDPDVINLGSGGRWVTAYVELPGLNPQGINLSTVRLAGAIPADPKFGRVGDHDGDGSPDLMVKFSRPALDAFLVPGINRLEVTGQLTSGQAFSGTGEVNVTDSHSVPVMASIAPNPLNPSGTLTFRTAAAGIVRLRIFDLRGRLVRTLIDSHLMAPGMHVARIDDRGQGGEDLASGVYFYRLETGSDSKTARFTILK